MLLIALGAMGCNGREEPWEPLQRDGVPLLRVLLTPSPVDSVTIGASGGYELLTDSGVVRRSAAGLRALPVTRQGGRWRLGNALADGGKVILRTALDGHVELDGRPYRGELHLLPTGGDRLSVVNVVDVESYLAGVLGKEIYGHWELETYRAQAIAARSFALHAWAKAGDGSVFDV